LRVGEEIFLAWPRGGLFRIALGDGREVAQSDLAQPVVAGPVAFGRRLILSSHDGTLLVVDRPKKPTGP